MGSAPGRASHIPDVSHITKPEPPWTWWQDVNGYVYSVSAASHAHGQFPPDSPSPLQSMDMQMRYDGPRSTFRRCAEENTCRDTLLAISHSPFKQTHAQDNSSQQRQKQAGSRGSRGSKQETAAGGSSSSKQRQQQRQQQQQQQQPQRAPL